MPLPRTNTLLEHENSPQEKRETQKPVAVMVSGYPKSLNVKSSVWITLIDVQITKIGPEFQYNDSDLDFSIFDPNVITPMF